MYTTDLMMERYALRDNRSTIAMVHFHLFTKAAISETFRLFLNANLHMETVPSLETFHHLVGLPNPFPGGDTLQNKLFDVFQVQHKADKLRIVEDIESGECWRFHGCHRPQLSSRPSRKRIASGSLMPHTTTPLPCTTSPLLTGYKDANS